jgi:uncharacterized membrane protein YcaP (DUF421 family)
MQWLFGASWRHMLVPDLSLVEVFVRGTVVYLVLFALLRFILKRESGAMSVTDLLVVVLIADAAQNAMSSEYNSVSDGLLLVATIVGWAALLDWLGYRWRWLARLLWPRPLLLVRDGKPLHKNMRRELLTEDQLRSQLRLQGLTGFEQVREAYMEPDGRISVIARQPQHHEEPERRSVE